MSLDRGRDLLMQSLCCCVGNCFSVRFFISYTSIDSGRRCWRFEKRSVNLTTNGSDYYFIHPRTCHNNNNNNNGNNNTINDNNDNNNKNVSNNNNNNNNRSLVIGKLHPLCTQMNPYDWKRSLFDDVFFSASSRSSHKQIFFWCFNSRTRNPCTLESSWMRNYIIWSLFILFPKIIIIVITGGSFAFDDRLYRQSKYIRNFQTYLENTYCKMCCCCCCCYCFVMFY